MNSYKPLLHKKLFLMSLLMAENVDCISFLCKQKQPPQSFVSLKLFSAALFSVTVMI